MSDAFSWVAAMLVAAYVGLGAAAAITARGRPSRRLASAGCFLVAGWIVLALASSDASRGFLSLLALVVATVSGLAATVLAIRARDGPGVAYDVAALLAFAIPLGGAFLLGSGG